MKMCNYYLICLLLRLGACGDIEPSDVEGRLQGWNYGNWPDGRRDGKIPIRENDNFIWGSFILIMETKGISQNQQNATHACMNTMIKNLIFPYICIGLFELQEEAA